MLSVFSLVDQCSSTVLCHMNKTHIAFKIISHYFYGTTFKWCQTATLCPPSVLALKCSWDIIESFIYTHTHTCAQNASSTKTWVYSIKGINIFLVCARILLFLTLLFTPYRTDTIACHYTVRTSICAARNVLTVTSLVIVFKLKHAKSLSLWKSSLPCQTAKRGRGSETVLPGFLECQLFLCE